jgi:hypothetical protein
MLYYATTEAAARYNDRSTQPPERRSLLRWSRLDGRKNSDATALASVAMLDMRSLQHRLHRSYACWAGL